MSRIPDDLKSKYNHDDKFRWVDSQLEKFMKKHWAHQGTLNLRNHRTNQHNRKRCVWISNQTYSIQCCV